MMAVVYMYILLNIMFAILVESQQPITIGGLFETEDLEKAFRLATEQCNQRRFPKSFRIVTSVIDIRNSTQFASKFCMMAEQKVVVIFGSVHPLTQTTMESYSRTMGIPYISHSHTDVTTGRNNGFQIYMSPVYEHAVIDVIKQLGWKHTYFMYDSFAGLHRVQQLYSSLERADTPASSFVNIELLKVSGPDDALKKLSRLHQQDPKRLRRLLVDMSLKDTQKLITKLYDLSPMMRSKFHTFVSGIGFNEMNISEFYIKQTSLNLTGMRIVNEREPDVERFFGLWKRGKERDIAISYKAALIKDSVSLFDKILYDSGSTFKSHLLKKPTSCLENVTAWQYGRDLARRIKKATFRNNQYYRGLTGWVQFDDAGYRRGFSLDVIEKAPNPSTGLAIVAKWQCQGTSYSENQRRDPSSCYSNIRPPQNYRPGTSEHLENKEPLKVTTHIGEPYMSYKKKSVDGKPLHGNDQFEGFCKDLAVALFNYMGLTFLIRPVKDKNYGLPDENGTWDGMVGELLRGEAHLAIADLSITSLREDAIYFSKPFMSLGISIMIKKPAPKPPNEFSFLTPLAYEVWMCIIFAYLGVSVVLFLVSRFSTDEWSIDDSKECKSCKNVMSIWNCLWFSLGAFMQQGCEICPKSTPGRIVSCVWWLFTLILISSYTANLAAFLTVSRMSSPIQSAADLAAQTVIKYGCIDSGTTKDFFRKSKVATYERMWSFMSTNDDVLMKSNKQGIEKVRESNGKYAFLIDSTTNDYVSNRKPCDTMQVGSYLNSQGFGIGMPLDSKYKERVTLGVLEMREQGNLTEMQDYWWKGDDICKDDHKEVKSLALSLPKIAGIFYILIGGLGIALTTAALEIMFYRKLEAVRTSSETDGKSDNVVAANRLDACRRRLPSSSVPYSYAMPTGQLIGFEPYIVAEPGQTQV